jgi:uncharacterized membrane protein YdjX (TVP38/TMEM64 family)
VTASSRKEYAWLTLVVGALLTALFVVRGQEEPIGRFIGQHPFAGVLLYLVLNIVDAGLVPGATLPLIPIASHVWGRIPAALVTTAGWTAGSMIAFLIARRWGYPIVQRITSVRRIREAKRFIPENLFWSVVLIRLIMPMDVISYVLGLFTDIGWAEYLLATALGLTPSAFLLAYLGQLPHAYELFAFGIGGVLLLGSLLIRRRRTRKAQAPP